MNHLLIFFESSNSWSYSHWNQKILEKLSNIYHGRYKWNLLLNQFLNYNEMKIIYIIDTLASKGGAERIITNKMDYMASFWGYEISIITCYQNSNTPNAYILSEKINQIYLDIPFYSQYKYKYPYRLYVKNNINKRLIKRWSETISELDPDIIIGVGYFNADIICCFSGSLAIRR